MLVAGPPSAVTVNFPSIKARRLDRLLNVTSEYVAYGGAMPSSASCRTHAAIVERLRDRHHACCAGGLDAADDRDDVAGETRGIALLRISTNLPASLRLRGLPSVEPLAFFD